MPGVYRYGINQLRAHLEPLVEKGLSSLLLFGVLEKLDKVSKRPVDEENNDCILNTGLHSLDITSFDTVQNTKNI